MADIEVIKVIEAGPQGVPGPLPWGDVSPWTTGVAYTDDPPASLVSYDGVVYVCIVAHTAGVSFDGAKWTAVLNISGALTARDQAVAAASTATTAAGTATSQAGISTASAGTSTAAKNATLIAQAAVAADVITIAADKANVAANKVAVAADRVLADASAAVASQALGLLADSTTSNTVAASGDKTFTVPTGKLFVAGMPMRVSSKANPDTQFMTGVVKSYSGTTLVFTSSAATGSATRTDWTLAVTGGAMAPVGATQDTQAVARYSEKLDGLRGAAITSSRPNILLDFLDNTYFVRGAYAGASMSALIAATSGSFFTRASTATYIGSNGLMQTAASGEPRFEYDPVTRLPLGLLVEPTRTNSYINSEAHVGGGSNKVSVSPDVSAGPDGLNTMDRVIEDSTSGEHFPVERTLSLTAGTVYCYSTCVRAGPSANRSLCLRVAGSTNVSVNFNPMTGTLSNPLGTGYLFSGFKDMGGGLYRVWLVFTAQATASAAFRLQLVSAGTTVYLGDGTSSVDIGFAQLEVGNGPSSYIPTGGSAVARQGEDYGFAHAIGLMPRAQGSIYTEFSADTPASTNNIPARFDNGTVPTDQLLFGRNSTGTGAAIVVASSATILSSTGSMAWPGDGIGRGAMRYAPNDVTRSWLGATPISVTGFTLFDGLNRIASAATAPLHVRRVAGFPGALTNAELQAITSATWN